MHAIVNFIISLNAYTIKLCIVKCIEIRKCVCYLRYCYFISSDHKYPESYTSKCKTHSENTRSALAIHKKMKTTNSPWLKTCSTDDPNRHPVELPAPNLSRIIKKICYLLHENLQTSHFHSSIIISNTMLVHKPNTDHLDTYIRSIWTKKPINPCPKHGCQIFHIRALETDTTTEFTKL